MSKSKAKSVSKVGHNDDDKRTNAQIYDGNKNGVTEKNFNNNIEQHINTEYKIHKKSYTNLQVVQSSLKIDVPQQQRHRQKQHIVSTHINQQSPLHLQERNNKYIDQQVRYQRHQRNKPQQVPLPGSANQWYTLNKNMNKCGTTIDMIYTGFPVPQPEEPLEIQALPGITRVTMQLPSGILPNLGTRVPDMSSLLNAIDFFRSHENLTSGSDIESYTTIQVIPKNSNNTDHTNDSNIESINVIPLSCVRAVPLKRGSLSSGFQSYSLMQCKVDETQSQEPDRVVFDAEISPTYLLSTHQQLRLQGAIQQDNVSLTDALMPIVNDLYEEHEMLYRDGYQLLPAPMPLPYGSMQFYCGHPPSLIIPNIIPTQRFSNNTLTGPINLKKNHGNQNLRQRRYSKHRQCDMSYSVDNTIMALDSDGKYHSMTFSEWDKHKMEETKLSQ